MCAEDVVLQHVGNDWICGPAADDANFVAATDGTCEYRMGTGDFAHGTWESYTCVMIPHAASTHTASVPMPDTAILHAEPMPLAALVLPVAVALASVIRAWRQIR